MTCSLGSFTRGREKELDTFKRWRKNNLIYVTYRISFALTRKLILHTGCLLISVPCLGTYISIVLWSKRAEILKI